LPIELDGERLDLRLNPPRVGEHSRAVLAEARLSDAGIDALIRGGVIV